MRLIQGRVPSFPSFAQLLNPPTLCIHTYLQARQGKKTNKRTNKHVQIVRKITRPDATFLPQHGSRKKDTFFVVPFRGDSIRT